MSVWIFEIYAPTAIEMIDFAVVSVVTHAVRVAGDLDIAFEHTR